MANYPTELEIVKENLDEKLPTKFCLKVRYIDYARTMVNDILNEYKSGNIIDLKGLTERIHNKGNELKEYCNKNTEIAMSYVDKMKMIKPDDLYASYLEYLVYYQGGDKICDDIINNGKNSDLPGKEYAYYYVLAELFKEIKQKQPDNKELVERCNNHINYCNKKMQSYISELFMQGLLYQNDKIKPGIKIRLDFSPYSNTIYETVTK